MGGRAAARCAGRQRGKVLALLGERERERERSDLMAEGRRLLSPAAIYRCSHRRQAQREAPSVRPTDADGRRSLAGWPAPRCLAQNKMFDGAETAARM